MIILFSQVLLSSKLLQNTGQAFYSSEMNYSFIISLLFQHRDETAILKISNYSHICYKMIILCVKINNIITLQIIMLLCCSLCSLWTP